MENYKILIVDDDETAILTLRQALQGTPHFTLCGEAHSAVEARELILALHPDLLFLDVELPDMKGMELLGLLHDELTWPMSVVFYTAYDQYMIDAIRQSAFDYLLKPFEPSELALILDRFIRNAADGCSDHSLAVTDGVTNDRPFLVAMPTNDMRVLRSSEVGYFSYRSDRKHWDVYLNDGTVIPLRRNVVAEQILRFSSRFVQVHQSFIINMDYLMIIRDNQCLLYPPFDGVSDIAVSRLHRKSLLARFGL